MESNLPKLIGIHGHAGAGKDTAADWMTETYKDHYSESFAAPLKDAASAAFGIYRPFFDSPEHKEISDDFWGVSPRQIAQFVGTEMFRQLVCRLVPGITDNFWAKRLEARLTNLYIPDGEGEYLPSHTVVIPDVRFQNEYDWIISNGGYVIHLTRPGADGAVGIPDHPSESSINLHSTERTYQCVNDSTLPELYRKIANIVIAQSY